MNKKCGGSWQGKSNCFKCGEKFDDYRAGSWDWQPHMCPDCKAYEVSLKLDEWKKENPEKYSEMVETIKKFSF